MKTAIILLPILLASTACAPHSMVAPIINPIPIPVTGVTPVATDFPVSTPVPVCTCPTSMIRPTQPPQGYASPDHIVCSCPAILVSPPPPLPGIEPAPQVIPAAGITLADNGKTFLLHPGESVLLNLGMEIYDWTVTIDDQNVLSRVRNIMVIRGAQGVYQAAQAGQAVLSAEGDPLCRKSTPACMAPSLMFMVTIIVQ